jgi:hypothetical protein
MQALRRSAKYDKLVVQNAERKPTTVEVENTTFGFIVEDEVSDIRKTFMEREKAEQERRKQMEEVSRCYFIARRAIVWLCGCVVVVVCVCVCVCVRVCVRVCVCVCVCVEVVTHPLSTHEPTHTQRRTQ